ncbi:GyrI-like domain-containing protein [Paenibacillus sp. MSJ-34]|uniref:AraC family transcriptional regulator n=1 Tax=Paenibacillus sp. MSJ-34 TaxID=2841529 RepID=UPI00209DE90E|nr:GyrI-like domain-containing protein [Paenibacillus sp. MSJ-34]
MITITDLPEYEVAYVRHVGSYMDTRVAWDKLGEWASRQGLTPHNQFFIGISLDDGNLVDEYACRYDACVTLPSGFEKHKHATHVQFQTLSGGMYALYSYYDTIDKLVLAYQNVFGLWLPNSEYEADDRPCLEFCMNDPASDPEGKCKVDLYVPIKKRA